MIPSKKSAYAWGVVTGLTIALLILIYMMYGEYGGIVNV